MQNVLGPATSGPNIDRKTEKYDKYHKIDAHHEKSYLTKCNLPLSMKRKI